MSKKHKKALVLNADYLPMGLVSWKRALYLGAINKFDPMKGLETIDTYKDDYILGANDKKYPCPAVCRCPFYVKRHNKTVPFSRKNVFLRDQMTCQYCGFSDGTTEQLTYDHVVPRSIWRKKNYPGTPTNWTNIVTCCEPCNKTKADRTPKEAKMTLLREPKEPNASQYIMGISPWGKIEEEWEPYLTPFYKHLRKGNIITSKNNE